ncbi:MAG: YIP1 family protein [Deltaproteobacteria bacterium]|nr:YIP1 family protein [Deltaproteobacteria bacterium]
MSDAAPPAAEQQTSATQGTAAAPVLGAVDDPMRQGPRPRALVLLEPRRAFLSVRAKPMAALALGVMLALSLAPPLAFVSQVDTTKLLERELKKSGKLEQIPPEQLEQMRSVGGTVMKVALPLGAVGKRALWIFVVTGLAFLLMRGARPELRFSTTLGAVALGCAPTALHDVATALTFLVKDPMTLADAQNAVLSNPAAWFALDTARSVAGALLHGLDFFTLWSCGLIAVGVNVVAGAKSVIPWAVTFGLHFTFVGLSAIGPAFQGG